MGVVHSDRAIAKRLLQGDEAAFRELFDSFFPKLYRFALARLDGNQDDAREVVQRTFCKAFERLDSYRGEASLYGWMCQICRNNIVDLARQRRRELHQVTLLEEDGTIQNILETLAAPPSAEPETQAWRMDLMRLIQATLGIGLASVSTLRDGSRDSGALAGPPTPKRRKGPPSIGKMWRSR